MPLENVVLSWVRAYKHMQDRSPWYHWLGRCFLRTYLKETWEGLEHLPSSPNVTSTSPGRPFRSITFHHKVHSHCSTIPPGPVYPFKIPTQSIIPTRVPMQLLSPFRSTSQSPCGIEPGSFAFSVNPPLCRLQIFPMKEHASINSVSTKLAGGPTIVEAVRARASADTMRGIVDYISQGWWRKSLSKSWKAVKLHIPQISLYCITVDVETKVEPEVMFLLGKPCCFMK